MPPFSNVALDYGNFSFGPVAGRVYSIDHTTDVMVVKTLAGSLVSTVPLNVGITNEVLGLEFDGAYFWSLSRLGSLGDLGVVINKWKFNSAATLLEKQTGVGNEINLLNTITRKYDGEAFAVERYTTALTFFASAGSSSITINSTTLLLPGHTVYIGPSTAASGEVEERTVLSVLGNVVTLNAPLTVNFNLGDRVVYRRALWFFNNKNNTEDTGSLIQIDSYTGSVLTTYSSCEWKHVTAATFFGEDLCFVRNHQLLRYKPFGANSGYQSSAILNNIEVDNTTLIKVDDIEVDSTTIYKLQKKQHQYDTISHTFSDVTSTTNDYELDTEIVASKVTTLTARRDKSVLFGVSVTDDFTIQIRDQYDIPIFGRSIAVTEDDSSGFITPGFTSFTSNVNGEGLTRYNTGSTPIFRNPTVFGTDVSTQLRVNIQVEQRTNVQNISFVQQNGVISNATFVVQDRLLASGIVEQFASLQGLVLAEQYAVGPNTCLVEQFVQTGAGLVQQVPALEQLTLIEQLGDIDGTVDLEQYVFLIFALPAPYSIKNPVDTDILLRIIGFGASPLNASTLIFKVNGIDVSGSVVVTPFGGGLELFYDPPVNFDYSSTVTIEVSIQDTNSTPRTVTTFYTFDIVPDTKKPFVTQVYPPDKSVSNDPLTEVYVLIKDEETGIEPSSVMMYLEGKKVTPTVTFQGEGVYKVSYQTLAPYFNLAELSVALFVEDLEGNKLVTSWTFTIRPSEGVLFNNQVPPPCDVLVPIDTDVCVEVFGLEDGIDLDSLTFEVAGKEVTYVLVPKVYRKE